LSSREKYREYQEYYSQIGYQVYITSALTGEGISELEGAMQNSVTALVGHSGVGKSSIIKAIKPEVDIKIQSVSERTRKGIHTTSHVQLFPIADNGYVVDTPGIRELGFWSIYKSDLPQYFYEFKQYIPDCQFGDCTHIHEPGCAVKAAVDQEEILEERYWNYVNIYGSLKSAHYE
jgi:ribosome biogenesis GTPase